MPTSSFLRNYTPPPPLSVPILLIRSRWCCLWRWGANPSHLYRPQWFAHTAQKRFLSSNDFVYLKMILCIWRGHLCTGCICLSRQFTLQTMSRQNLKTWRVQLTLGKEGHRKGIAIRNLWFTNQKLWSPCYICHKFEWFPFRHQVFSGAGTFFLCILTILKMWKKSSCLCSGLLRCFKWWKMNLWISSTAFAKFTMSFFAMCFFKLSQNSGNMVEYFSFPFFPKSFKSTLILSDQSWLSSGCFAWNTRRDDAGKMQDTKMKRCKGAKMPNFPGAECTH